MAYRKLGRTNKHRKSMLANLTKDLIQFERIETTETRAKEVRKFFDKMITYGKDGSLVSRRKALAFLGNDDKLVKKVFDDLAPRFAKRNGGYTRILKLTERRGDDALMVVGNRYAIELHILMNGEITLARAHDHADSIENQLKKRFGEHTHVAIHMEPSETENPT